MKVGAVQHDILWQDVATNFHRLEGMIQTAAHAGAELVILPTRFATGVASTRATAAEDDELVVAFLTGAASTAGCAVCGSSTAQYDRGAVTTMLLVEPDGSVHRSIQRDHNVGGASAEVDPSAEFSTVTIGELRVTPVSGGRLGDPGSFQRAAAETDVFVVSAHRTETRSHQWKTLLAARAIENQCYVVGVNRVGTGGNSTFVGDSRIIDPQGSVLTSAWGSETILYAELESALVRFTRDRGPQQPTVVTI